MADSFYEFVQFPLFSKQLDKLNDPELLNTIEEELVGNPEAGSLLKGGVRKVRIASQSEGRGKRGGFRVWYYFYQVGDQILLLYLLDKRDSENISKKQEDILVAILKKALDEALTFERPRVETGGIKIMAKGIMKDEHFQELLTSVHQMGDYLKGKKVPGVKITYRPKPATAQEVKQVRAKLGVTQEEFSKIVGEGVGAIRTWEQGVRNPSGAATKIIRYVMQHPKVAKDLLVA